MGLADTIMAGRVSSTDMAAISVGASIWMPLVLFGQGLLLALPPTISYLNGSGQRHRIAHQVRQGIWLVLGVSIPLGLLIYFCEISAAIYANGKQNVRFSTRLFTCDVVGIACLFDAN